MQSFSDFPSRGDPSRSPALRNALQADGAARAAFDRLARLAARALHAAVAQVNFVSDDRQISVSSVGDGKWSGSREVPLEFSYCKQVVRSGEPLLVEDARMHPLLQESPATTEYGVVAYAAVPLVVAEDLVLGTLCVFDFAPRAWTDEDAAVLESLAEFVVAEIRRRGHTEVELMNVTAVLEGTEDAVIGMDLEGTVTSWNPGAERMLGFRPEEMVGRSKLTLVPPECREEALHALHRVGCGESTPRVDTARVARDGSLVPVSHVATPVRDLADRVVGATVLLRDITSRVRMLQALTESEARFRSLIEHSDEIITVLALDGSIRYDSPAVERILGYAPDERVGTNVFEYVHPEDREGMEQRLARILERPLPMMVECRARHRDGSYRVLSATGVNLLHDPAVGGIVVNSRDVTELREGEERLRHAQKLEAVGRLAGGIAHDFNNILTTITGTAQILLMDLPEDSPWREDVVEIDRACTRATVLTRQLLTFSRQQVLHPEVLDLNAVVSDAERMLCRTLGADIELVSDLEPALWPVRADRGQLEQILMNLAVNARDAMPRGGTLTTRTRNVAPARAAAGADGDLRQGGECVELTVSDTGTGMPEEVRQRIFEPFYTTKPEGKGTGLGLATVYGIVQQSGGSIRAESEMGRGTTFRVLLPRAPETPPA